MKPLKSNRLLKGFTLVELLVVVVIIGILAAIAMPAFRQMTMQSRLAGEANDLMTDLAFARAEAGRRGKRVTVCLSSNGTSCATTGNAWNAGRLIFVDIDEDGVVDTGEILRVSAAVTDKNVSIETFDFTTLYSIFFRPNGVVSSSGCFVLKEASSSLYPRQVVMLTTGRVTLNSPANSAEALCS